MGIKLISRSECAPFEIEEAVKYEFVMETENTSLAKTYETGTQMKVLLEVAKAKLQEEKIQSLLKWAELPITDKNYYRDLGVEVKARGGMERSIVFSHAEISANVKVETQKVLAVIEILVRQKKDKQAGVVLGRNFEETYKEAKERGKNPPIIPVLLTLEGDKKEYAGEQMMHYIHFYTQGKERIDFAVQISTAGWLNEKKETVSKEDLYSKGYRYHSIEQKGNITIQKYVRTIVKIKVNVNFKEKGSYEGYIANGKVYAIEPDKLLKGLGYSCKEKKEENEYEIKKQNLQTLKISKAVYGGIYLKNLELDKIQKEIEKQLDSQYKWDKNRKTATFEIFEPMIFSSNRKELLKNLELENYELQMFGKYDKAGKLIGIYPYYTIIGKHAPYPDDGGITLGYGHHISAEEIEKAKEYDRQNAKGTSEQKERDLLYQYVKKDTPLTNLTFKGIKDEELKVKDSSYVPIEKVNELLESDIIQNSDKINDFLKEYRIGGITQNEFDALLIYRFQRGSFSKDAVNYLNEGNRNRKDWEKIWTGGENRREKCQELFFEGKY